MTRKTTIKVATLLSTVALATTAIGTYYLTNTTNTQTPIPTNAITTQTQQFEQDDLNVVTNDSSSMKLQVSRVNAQPSTVSDDVSTQALESSYTLTATITPSNVDNKTVIWECDWANPDSTWATGKDAEDYIDLDDEELTCKVTVTEAFGEEIIITCRSWENPKAIASCTVNYVKRISYSHGSGCLDINRKNPTNATMDPVITFSSSMCMIIDKSPIKYGVGTLTGSLSYGLCEFYLSDDVKTSLREKVPNSTQNWGFTTRTFSFANGMNTDFTIGDPATAFISYYGAPTDKGYADVHAALVDIFNDGGTIIAKCPVTYSYNGTVISNIVAMQTFTVDVSSMAIIADDITLDSSEIIF